MGLGPSDKYETSLKIDLPDNEFDQLEHFAAATQKNTNFRGLLSDAFLNMPVFFAAFYQLFITKDLQKAKRYFKHALNRSECAKGSFQLLCSIYIQ